MVYRETSAQHFPGTGEFNKCVARYSAALPGLCLSPPGLPDIVPARPGALFAQHLTSSAAFTSLPVPAALGGRHSKHNGVLSRHGCATSCRRAALR